MSVSRTKGRIIGSRPIYLGQWLGDIGIDSVTRSSQLLCFSSMTNLAEMTWRENHKIRYLLIQALAQAHILTAGDWRNKTRSIVAI